MSVKEFIITDNAIDLAIERLENLEESGLNNLFERLSHQQPNVMGFVVGLGEGLKSSEAEEDLIYLTMIVWHAVELARNKEIPTISEDELDDIEKRINARYDLIMSFSEEEEEEELNSLIGGSSQPAIVSFLADEFFSEEYLNLSEENVAKMFACMTVLAESLSNK